MDAGREKWGLALSGGGFRASFFHLGVLARLAEMGLLQRVEVISTVSGGSILGALYYVHVKRLLEEKADGEITGADYLQILLRIEREFLAAVQGNMRMRTFLNPMKNIRMAFANYSRSDRIGELYDELLYRPVLAPGREASIEMRELFIHPKGDRTDFYPRDHNVGRNTKAPILILNASTLNTGHNWRFEASRMGEPPRGSRTAQEVDKNMRLRQPPSYNDITPRQQNIELGLGVAASACVPGIFAPLAISGLYDREIRVQLVDGGVHDNQGIQGLVDEKCTHFIVSDASGQMQDEMDPPAGVLSVLMRSNDILMDRVREEELFGILGTYGRRLALMHLRKGLSAEAIAWIDKDGKPAAPPKTERVPGIPCGQFGVDPRVQDRLSKIRTDLDSFTEIEASSRLLHARAIGGGRDLASMNLLRRAVTLPEFQRRETPERGMNGHEQDLFPQGGPGTAGRPRRGDQDDPGAADCLGARYEGAGRNLWPGHRRGSASLSRPTPDGGIRPVGRGDMEGAPGPRAASAFRSVPADHCRFRRARVHESSRRLRRGRPDLGDHRLQLQVRDAPAGSAGD